MHNVAAFIFFSSTAWWILSVRFAESAPRRTQPLARQAASILECFYADSVDVTELKLLSYVRVKRWCGRMVLISLVAILVGIAPDWADHGQFIFVPLWEYVLITFALGAVWTLRYDQMRFIQPAAGERLVFRASHCAAAACSKQPHSLLQLRWRAQSVTAADPAAQWCTSFRFHAGSLANASLLMLNTCVPDAQSAISLRIAAAMRVIPFGSHHQTDKSERARGQRDVWRRCIPRGTACPT